MIKNGVGIVRIFPEMDELTEYLLASCHRKGIPACTYRLTDIDMETGTVPALRWDSAAYRDCVTEIPPISECRFLPDSQKVINYAGEALLHWLKERTFFTDGSGLKKEALSQLLMMSELYQYAIPTYRVASVQDISRYVSMFGRCIVKPSAGRLGKYVMAAEPSDSGMVLFDGTNRFPLTRQFWDDYSARLEELNFGHPILQPRLNFTLDDDHAMDIRILVSRGGTGDWETVRIRPRIGGNALVSNVAHGGAPGELHLALPQIAGAQADRVYDELVYLGHKLPRVIDSFVPGQHSCFGIDVGIDRDTLQLYIIEANTMPGASINNELAEVRTEYFRYLLNHIKDQEVSHD